MTRGSTRDSLSEAAESAAPHSNASQAAHTSSFFLLSFFILAEIQINYSPPPSQRTMIGLMFEH
ncbi:uncharacterized protein N7529_003075 [Penicillium soppii]|uniref:uncharacterized protein n=1 Tax=Penicillium soppii TaxID=69789 RepID=UPI0025499FEB|nr:uncharacterized protein N7529_003075 [Penicillium soppii]KAJ5874645.1 hypothetical protein N7529_003075 [Penicillium soppii]